MQPHDQDDARQDAALRLLTQGAPAEAIIDPASPELQRETLRARWTIQNRQRAERRALQRIRVAYRGMMR